MASRLLNSWNSDGVVIEKLPQNYSMNTAQLEYPICESETSAVDVSTHVDKWRNEEGNLIMILHEIQNEHGYVPRESSMELARALGVPLARIYEVITFYHYFKLIPPGKAQCCGL